MAFANAAVVFIVLKSAYTSGYVNIALNKPTWQSSAYNPEDGRFNSSNAVDGLKDNLSAWGGQCAVSGDGHNTATWWVNLTSIQSIHNIRIYYRTDNAAWGVSNGYTERFLGFHVYISNTTNRLDGHLCFHDTSYTRATIPPIANITCPVHGQYVIYYNVRPQDVARATELSQYAFNELCEVEVYCCKYTGYYGQDCSLPCPDTNCRYCHIETGACQGCNRGYQGHQCELPCSRSSYGEICSTKCGNCSEGRTCHHVNGSCTNGCDVGVYGDKCRTACPVGWHGHNCSQMCNCDECDRFSGQCSSPCYPGWDGLFCKDECNGGVYGQACGQRCGACLGYNQCHHINGSCLEGCDAGFEGDICKIGKCEGGCQPGWEGPRCDQVCKTGFYGENCKRECSLFCKTSRDCNHVTGHCNDGCIGGWQGVMCLQVAEKKDSADCQSRFYGVLAVLCLCLLIIAILVAYICFYRWSMEGKLKKLRYNEDKKTKVAAFNMDIISSKVDEDDKNGYQELGELALSSDYDRI